MRAIMDHIVLNVRDVEGAVRFYTEVVGLSAERLDAYRQGKAPFPSVRVGPETVIDFLPPSWWQTGGGGADANARPNMAHFCLAVSREDWGALMVKLETHGVTVHTGPITRWGARGDGVSIYFCDPEGNEVEVRYYGAG